MNESTKSTVFAVVFRILVALSFSWAIWYNSQSFFNMLPFMAEGQDIISMWDYGQLRIMFLVVLPIVSTLIVFGLFILLENMAANGIERNLLVFGKTGNKNWHKRAMELAAMGIAICKGIVETILSFNPLASNIARPLIGFFIKVIFIGLLFLAIAKKDTKEMFPFVFTSLMFPTMLVALFV